MLSTEIEEGSQLMNPELMTLMELQDLRAQHRALSGGESESVEVEQFNIDPTVAAARLEEVIAELEGRLSPPVLKRYRQIAPNRERVVVPVIHGVCYGCFVSIPTATAGDQDVHNQVRTCQSCGSFIYVAS
ncbi:MAG: hypothetical protein EA351_01465 [Gemmatimonadales bacterium]|nr:MAG: hypothetical protein EA351_01465 [Gemmatimonadales bacterium]